MAADLPKEFDVIVLGSGMPESIVAAAFSRIGKTVLHLDRNTYYSGDWASFNLQGIEKWADEEMGKNLTEIDHGNQNRPVIDEDKVLEEGEILVELPLKSRHFTNVQLQFHVHKQDEDEAKNKAEVVEDAHAEKCFKEQTRTDIYESKTDDISKDIAKSTHSIHRGSGDNDKVKSQSVTDLDSDIGDSDGNSKGGEDGNSRVDTHSVEHLAVLKINKHSDAEKGITETTDENESKLDDEIAKVDELSETVHNVDQSTNRVNKDSETNLEHSGEVSTNTCETDKADQKEELGEDTGIAGVVLEETGPKIWTEKGLRDEWRRFNLDLSPKVLYCGGEMVELLISSDIAKYCEFKTVTRVLTVIDGKVDKVPCSRADVFSSKKVSMLEKRMLMKFLQFCLQYENNLEEIKEFLDKPFTEFLSSRKLTAQIKHFVQHSIAMATDSTTTKQGLERTQKFLQSIGRYGNTAFLWSLYGSGELPQSFCRMCAVFGGTYCLNMSASSVILDSENKCKGIVTTEGQRIACKWLIMESSYANPELFLTKGNERFISRAILVADKPILRSDSQELSMMCLPCPDDGDRPIFVLELPPAAMACPPDLYVFHLTRQSRDGIPSKSDLAYALDTLFQEDSNTDENSDKPKILWSVYFTQLDNSAVNVSDRLPENVFIMSGPGIEVDIDRPVQEARELFQKILPEEEFLPKAPNPEDIIYVDDTEAKVSEDSSQSEFGTQDSDQSQSSKDDIQSEVGTLNSDQSQPSKDNSQSEVGTLDSEQSQPFKDNTQLETETHNSDQSQLSKDDSQLELGIQDQDQSQPSKGFVQSESAE